MVLNFQFLISNFPSRGGSTRRQTIFNLLILKCFKQRKIIVSFRVIPGLTQDDTVIIVLFRLLINYIIENCLKIEN